MFLFFFCFAFFEAPGPQNKKKLVEIRRRTQKSTLFLHPQLHVNASFLIVFVFSLGVCGDTRGAFAPIFQILVAGRPPKSEKSGQTRTSKSKAPEHSMPKTDNPP